MPKSDHFDIKLKEVQDFLKNLKLKGSGFLIRDMEKIEGNFHLRLKKDGGMMLHFSSTTNLNQKERRFVSEKQRKQHSSRFGNFSNTYLVSEPYSMQGVCDNGWPIEISRVYQNYSYNSRYFILRTRGDIVIKMKNLKSDPDSYVFGIINLFREDISDEPFSFGSANVHLRSILSRDNALNLLKRQSLRSIMTHLIVADNLKKIGYRELVNNICWLLSFAENNLVIPICCFKYIGKRLMEVEFWYNREANITDRSSSILFPQWSHDSELRRFLNECFSPFNSYVKPLDLDAFIYTYLSAQSTTPTTKIAIRLIGLLMICNNYLECHDVKRPEDYFDFVPLLRKLDTRIQFLTRQDSKSLEQLRSQVRNALFHTGQIKSLTLDQRLLVSQVLESLTQRSFLRILGFKGRFKDSLGVSRQFA